MLKQTSTQRSVSCLIEAFDTVQPNASPIRHEPFIYFLWRPQTALSHQAMVLLGSSTS